MSGERAPSLPHDGRITTLDRAVAPLVGLLFLVASVRFGGSVAGDELDPAWTMVLRWASLKGLHWGSDIAFTYGPLGYLSPLNASDPAHYGAFVAVQIALAAAAAFLFANAWVAQRWPERGVLVAAVLFTAPMLAADPVWLSMPVIAIVGLQRHAIAGRRRALTLLLVVTALYLSTILLIKMSSLLLIVASWIAGTVVLLHARLRYHATVWLLLLPLCSLALWLMAGQRLGDLLPFIALVLEISHGYTGAMGYFPPLRYDLYGVAVIGCSGGVALWAAWRARHDVARLACIALCGLTLFIAWRAGFTRADTHVVIFVLTAWLVLPLLAATTPAPPRALRVACLVLALAAAPIADRAFNPGMGHRRGELATASLRTLKDNARLLLRPLTYQSPLVAAIERERVRLDLPQTRAAIGTRSIDLSGTQQGVVILNGFAYRPSPVFQGYGAYTPHLQTLNAAAYSGADRTNFVLLAFSPIDGNLPTSENALAFTTLYRNYHPVLVEKSYLLLERDAGFAPPQAPLQGDWRAAVWNEWIDLPTTPDTVAVLAVRSDLSVAGKAMATLLREPAQFIELELADGTVHRYRLVRGAATGGFVASPLLRSFDDYVRFFVGTDLPAVRRFRLVPQSEAMLPFFTADIRWNAAQVPRRPRGELPSALFDALFPGFSHRPTAVTDGVHSADVNGHRVLFMHSPAQLTFKPGAGRYVVSGEIGIVPNAFTSAGCERADGIVLKASGEAGETFAFPYDPFADPTLRPGRRFELGPVTADADGALRLEVTLGAANNGDCDWTAMRNVKIRPM